MEALYCCFCKDEIERRSQNPNQTYCKKSCCQNARKQLSKAKKRKDPNYRETERHDQAQWRRENPGYMPKYREEHPEYVEENRRQQGLRNRYRGGELGRKTEKASSNFEVLIVNGDAWEGLGGIEFVEKRRVSGNEMIVNGDASNPLVPMLLLSKSMVKEIVKATRHGPSCYK